jgi:hypothetical protein
MKTKLMGAAFVLLMGSGAAIADGMPIHADDPWARAIGDTRTLENDHIGCATQRNVDLIKAVQRTPGLSMDVPSNCTLFLRGEQVVVVNLEYGLSGTAVYAQIHLVGDMRRYWVDAPVELFEAK